MHRLEKWISDWAALLALCAFAGFLACVNHTPVQQLTAKRFALHILCSVFIGVVGVHLLDGMDWTDKTKLGVAVVLGYAATPILHGVYRLANLFKENPERFVGRGRDQ